MISRQRSVALKSMTIVLLAGVMSLVGCVSSEPPKGDIATVPTATFTGPEYLYGTVGSLTKLHG